MRARLIFIVLAIVLVAGFAAQNWPEFTSRSTLNFGVVSTSAPLGLILLGLLAIVLAVFLVSSATQESRHLLEHRRASRALAAQRDLAEKAESSRYTELRQHLDNQLRDVRQQRAVGGPEFERSVLQGQRELRTQMEQLMHTLTARIGDLESRIGGHPPMVEQVEPLPPGDVPLRDRVRL